MARHWYSNLKQEAYSKWHRKFEGIAMIDVDSVEVCKHCYKPLAFIELAKDTGQKFKATTLIKKLALKFEVPGYLVFYKTDDQDEIINFRIKRVARNEGMMHENVKPEKWLGYLQQLQKEHYKECDELVDITGSYGGTI
tara:strand:- start:3178 stop:3594 length:417 start_codon:yes stop_codon:yes gene_type:complete